MSRRAITVVVIVLLAWGGLVVAFLTDTTPRLGLDLVGGTSVILEAPEGTEEELVLTAVEVMRRRIEDFGSVQEPEIAVSGGTSVLIQLPGVTDQVRALDAIGQTGELSFRPVLGRFPVPPTDEELALLVTWIKACATGFGDAVFIDPANVADFGEDPDISAEAAVVGEYDDLGELLSVYVVGPAQVTGSDIESALSLFGIQWTVQLNLTDSGAVKFADVTGELANRAIPGFPITDFQRLAIVLDGQVTSAPFVYAAGQDQGNGTTGDVVPCVGIEGGTASITVGGGADAQQESQDLTTVLRYGSLPVAFERSSVQKVSATLGDDSLQTGLLAGVGGLILVVLFLLLYYRAMGLVTLLGLTVFASFLVVIFGVLGAWQGLTLTLAGVAGVIVSIGITADSYIVFFERTKEEVRKGRTVVDATEEAFRRAFRTILTADFVSFMGALLLWALAVGPVKGFAQALGIATVLDVFVAYYFTRNAVAVVARSKLGETGRFSIRAASFGSKEVTS